MLRLERVGVIEILGREIEFYGSWEEPYFKASAVANWLDERDGSTVARKVDDDEKIKAILLVTDDKTTRNNHGGARKNTEYLFLTKKGLKQCIANSRKFKSKTVSLDIDDYVKHKNIPKQIKFEGMLKNAINIHLNSGVDYDVCPFNSSVKYKNALNFKIEYPVGKYKVDFYFELFGLVIEYDESHHKYREKQDKNRECEIHEILNDKLGNTTFKQDGSIINIIRVEEGKEFEGIIKILSHLQSIFI